MRFSIVWTIFRKELIDSLRDRRTLIMMVGVPLLLYPLLVIGAAKLQESQSEASEARNSKVALWGRFPAALVERLKAHGKIEVYEWLGAPSRIRLDLEAGRLSPPPRRVPVAPRTPAAEKQGETKAPPEPDTAVVAAARPVILNRRVEAVLVAWPGLAEASRADTLGHVSVLYDSVRADSRKAQERLTEEANAFRLGLVADRVRARSLDPGFATAVEMHSQNVAPPDRRTGMLLGSVLGYMLILISAMGGFYSAIDLTAGEKERGTMQTLLCAPVRSTEIIGGKFLAVWVISLLATLANLASMGATFSRVAAFGGEMRMTIGAYALTLVVLLPVSFLLSALFLAVAAFAKDFKDGQNYLTPLLMALIMPLFVAATPQVELNPWTAFVPLVNIALLIKALFVSEAKPDAIFLTLLSSAAYAMLAILLAAKVFEREAVMLGGRESLRGMFTIRRRPGETPDPSLALLLFAVVLVLAFYGSLLLSGAGTVVSILVIQYGFFLLPCLAIVAGIGFSARKTLALRLPPWRGLLAAVLLGLSAWTLAAGLLVRLLPPPESMIKAFEKIFLLREETVPLWMIWLLFAATPGLCEEILFRGFIQSGLRGLGKWPALLVTALLFGLAHSSIYRLLPTMALGLVIGYTVWKTRSIVCGMIIHALSNGVALTLARSETLVRELGLKGVVFLPWSITLAGGVVVLVGLLLLRGLPEET